MKRYLAITFALCSVSAGLLAAQTKEPETNPNDPVVKADQALVAAFYKGDKATINKYLDADFSWIDTDGIMWARPEVLRAGLKPLVPVADDAITGRFIATSGSHPVVLSFSRPVRARLASTAFPRN